MRRRTGQYVERWVSRVGGRVVKPSCRKSSRSIYPQDASWNFPNPPYNQRPPPASSSSWVPLSHTGWPSQDRTTRIDPPSCSACIPQSNFCNFFFSLSFFPFRYGLSIMITFYVTQRTARWREGRRKGQPVARPPVFIC